jgi:hypothetical protein
MKLYETQIRENAEETYSVVLVVILLILLPRLNSTGMLVGSILGLAGYTVLFRERLRHRGWLRPFALATFLVAVAGAGIAVALHHGR